MTERRGVLRTLLADWLTPGLDHESGFRFHDAPPAVVRDALSRVDPSWRDSRPNGQPPGGWLVDLAERLGGLLAGQVGDNDWLPERLRVDAVCVPGERSAELARAVDEQWPQPFMEALALDLALAEAWDHWDAETPVWSGPGRDLLTGEPRAAVVGLWWD